MKQIPFFILFFSLITNVSVLAADRCEKVVSTKDCANCGQKNAATTGETSPHLNSLSGKIEAKINQARVQVFETTYVGDKIHALVAKPALDLDSGSSIERPEGTAPENIPIMFEIDPRDQRQQMQGYGAAFTESCTMQVNKLPHKQRQEFLRKMFSKKDGAGFDLMRLPMGSTDFSDGKRGSYTYNDTKGDLPDPEFKQFDMSRDEPTFALIREALKVNPSMKILVSPWSAPAWMKDSKSINGGGLLHEHYQDYANYFVKVLREYEKRGIPVTSLTVQNEPYFDWEGVPSMLLPVEDQIRFIGEYLGPTLKKANLDTKIIAYDHNWSGADEANQIIDSPSSGKYVGGAAFHCYNGSPYTMLDTARPHPNLPILQTECTGTDDPENTPQKFFHFWAETQSIGAARMFAAGGIAWNLCLDQNHGPTNWKPGLTGCKTCRGLATIDSSKKTPKITYNPEFYALAQVSRFIDPSFRHVATEDEWKSPTLHVAPFVNVDGQFVIAAQNLDTKPATIQVRFPDCRSFTYKMPAGSAATFNLELGSLAIPPI
ncbi:MAG: glycoside hydrolase family 30 protein [Bdellovibrionota bacterium]